jgi:excisionase family DNA binding protein
MAGCTPYAEHGRGRFETKPAFFTGHEGDKTMTATHLLERIARALENNGATRPTLNTEQAAEYLGISETSLGRLHSEYKIPFVRLGGRIVYRRKDLDRFIDDRLVSSVDDERRVP